jgi:hypothetical protein
MIMRKAILLALASILTACGGETQSDSPYEEAHAAAVAAMDIAAERGHAWMTSDQLIKDAEKAAADGDEARAILLADEARIHAELAVIQADKEAVAWRDKVIS